MLFSCITMRNSDLKRRIIEISKRFNASHVGSCLSVLPILEEIYSKKNESDVVFIDNAHCHLTHLVVKEHCEGMKDIEEVYEKWGIHCDRKSGCDFSGGSLGHVGVSIGYAIGHPEKTVYVIISDGSCVEGSFSECLRILHDLKLPNIEIHANFNGYTATTAIDVSYWKQWINGFGVPIHFHHTDNGILELDGVKGHYEVLK